MPILAPVLLPLGIDPVHFGIIFTHNMEVGLVHPPVGLNLYVLSTISDAPIGEVIRGILPFLVILLIVLGHHHLCARADLVAAAAGLRQLIRGLRTDTELRLSSPASPRPVDAARCLRHTPGTAIARLGP